MKYIANLVILFYLSIFSISELSAVVGSVVSGQPLWGISKRIGETDDVIESKVDNLTADVSINNAVLDSQLDIIESKVDGLSPCEPTLLSSADIVGGEIKILSSGSYCLSEDVTAIISIRADFVSLDLNNRTITGSLFSTSDADDFVVHDGIILSPAPTTPNVNALTVLSTSDRVLLKNLTIWCADAAGTAIPGRHGIRIDGDDTTVENCTVTSGGASDGDGSTTTGADGGFGIRALGAAANTVIRNCIIVAGNGGSAPGAGGTGGLGGSGIFCLGTDLPGLEIEGCIILKTGDGGDGDAGSGTGGAGGEGIWIVSTCADVSVHDCTIRNTGSGGAGNTPGAAGRAIHDDVGAGANQSIIYRNFAHNIANAVKFDLQASGVEKGVNITNPPTGTVVNPFANVYVS